MRVTKVIRDYVEEAVNGIYDPIIRNCSKDYSKKKDEVEGIIAKMADEFCIQGEYSMVGVAIGCIDRIGDCAGTGELSGHQSSVDESGEKSQNRIIANR